MTRVVEQFDVMVETPVLRGPVLLIADGDIGSLRRAPECHRPIHHGFYQMGIRHHLPRVPVLHVVGLVLPHVLLLDTGLAQLRDGIVVQWLPCAKHLMADSDGSAHHAPVRDAIYPDILCRLRQWCEEDLQIDDVALLGPDGKVLAVGVWFCTADTVLCARLLIHETGLF